MRMLLGVESQLSRAQRPEQLEVRLASAPAEVEAAQRLRYRVFAQELGARIRGDRPGIDADRFDDWCDHLIVHDPAVDEVVGTYRLLDPQAARSLGTYYADTEFDLARLHLLRDGMAEIGRACIHPDYRTGGVIARLWQTIAGLALARGYRHLIGCSSMSVADGGAAAALAFERVLPAYVAPLDYRVVPRTPLTARSRWRGSGVADLSLLPPLLRAYLRLGAWIGGAPAWDPDFGVADFFVLLPLERLAPRYARHFMKAA